MPQYNFLWKFESDTLPIDLPKNVMVKAWLPQNDLLGHESVIAFITHGGFLSVTEANYHGVPMIGKSFVSIF